MLFITHSLSISCLSAANNFVNIPFCLYSGFMMAVISISYFVCVSAISFVLFSLLLTQSDHSSSPPSYKNSGTMHDIKPTRPLSGLVVS